MKTGTVSTLGNLMAACLAGLICAGCTTTPTSPKALGPVTALPGSEWSNVQRDSGSYGSGVSHVAFKAVAAQNWQGRQHYAHEGPESTTLIDPTSGRWAAWVKDGKPLVSWDPPIGYHWPMWVGESWSTPYRVTNHATNKTTEMRAWFWVEAHENVNVPAGSYKAFKIHYSDPTLTGVMWWSPDLGLWVKSRFERNSNHPAGPGVREQDLLRVNVKR